MSSAWVWVTIAGLSIQAPPPECTVGPLPDHEVMYTTPKVMRALGPSARIRPGHRLYGLAIIGEDRSLIMIDGTLPPEAREIVLEHERAHLRGCTHG